ncbi:AN1-type zinc finger protein 1 isoform X4 [Hemicordylus capensis]|uniref:AN1-type zinc finger protein 1 isoform X4 n=1 Tax=Hemicordylus capensis TaxID=884348 RepID=UPI002303BE14|nr:AN1-type zinc finger protein 1 isoform X4 [Hemicordylus capensis]
MAELEIGQHCGIEQCRQLDFLPFVCDGCSGVFCLEHRSRTAHDCSEVNLKTEEVKPDNHKFFMCTYKSCDGKELVPVLCPYCEKPFCLRHRHQVDHECEKLETPKPRMAVTQQLVKDIVDSKKEATVNKRCRGAKNSETAAKVALMKLKMHACGDKSLPQKLRLCHTVSGEALPLDHTIASWIGTKEFSLCNGGSVVLEYLENDLQFLEDAHSYLE